MDLTKPTKRAMLPFFSNDYKKGHACTSSQNAVMPLPIAYSLVEATWIRGETGISADVRAVSRHESHLSVNLSLRAISNRRFMNQPLANRTQPW